MKKIYYYSHKLTFKIKKKDGAVFMRTNFHEVL